MSDPLVTVVMSMHNEQDYVEAAVRSVLAQTMDRWELIIIDDHSSDRSVEICRGFDDPRIRLYVKTSQKPYLAASRNLGIQMARGRFVTFQDADDVSAPQRLERQLETASREPGPSVVGCWVRRIQDGREKLCRLPPRHEQIVKGFRRQFRRTTIVGGTILAPRELMRRVPYRTRFRYMQDWDQLLRLHEAGGVRFTNVPQPLYDYHIRPKGVLAKPLWLDCNMYVRHCQRMRRLGRPEFASIEQFMHHLSRHPLSRVRWMGLRSLVQLRNSVAARLRATRRGQPEAGAPGWSSPTEGTTTV